MTIVCTTLFIHRMNRLTWHDGLIPLKETWVKIGGDKGGSILKAAFQLCNAPRANSVQNTCVFSVFEARDSPSNLHIALDRYHNQIGELQSTEWRYESLALWLIVLDTISKCFYRGKKIGVFMYGDYEFLCRMYGTSGAQGDC